MATPNCPIGRYQLGDKLWCGTSLCVSIAPLANALQKALVCLNRMNCVVAIGRSDSLHADPMLSKPQSTGEVGLNFIFSIAEGIEPSDQVEAMLAARMTAAHVAAMRSAMHLAHAKTFEEQDSHERALNKLMRTFVSQMEALKRYRTGGEQKVTMQHSVSESGQAIVGNVTQTPRKDASEQPAASPLAITDAKAAPMPPAEK